MKQTQNQQGFALIDSVIAMALIILAALILGLVYPGIRVSKLARAQIVASSIAEKKMDELKQMAFDDLAQVAGQSFADPDLAKLQNSSAQYTVELFDADGDGTDETNIKQIKINVTWNDGTEVRTHTIASLFAQAGSGQ